MIGYPELLQHVDAAMAAGAQSRPFALLLVRQSGLREIERIFGHAVGQALVLAIGERIREALRPGDGLVMIGDGDYAAVVDGIRGENHASLAAAKVARLLAAPIEAAGLPLRLQMAVGVAVWPQHGEDAGSLCLAAEAACVRAHELRERYAMHVPGPREALVDYASLHAAVHGNGLRVFLQPVVDVRGGELRALESLARWPDPSGDWVPPDQFIPVAERSGLIDELTRWSVDASLCHCALWRVRQPQVCCSVNVSPLTLVRPDFAEMVSAALSVWGVPASCLVLEVTETAFADRARPMLDSLRELRQAGVRIAIDDFGSGYSSFAYLRRFPVDELKIDMAFVRHMADNQRDRELVAAMVGVAHRLGACAVAEGVEDARTVELLQDMGCDLMQGYHIARPADAVDVVAALVGEPATPA